MTSAVKSVLTNKVAEVVMIHLMYLVVSLVVVAEIKARGCSHTCLDALNVVQNLLPVPLIQLAYGCKHGGWRDLGKYVERFSHHLRGAGPGRATGGL